MLQIISSLLILIGFTSFQTEYGIVKVEITNLETREGKILLSVFDKEDGFPGKKGHEIKNITIEVGEEKCSTEFELPPGVYAISVAHDINNNNEVDTNFLGIPKEPLGMSNYSEMARPKFDKAKFEVKAGQTISFIIPVNTIF